MHEQDTITCENGLRKVRKQEYSWPTGLPPGFCIDGMIDPSTGNLVPGVSHTFGRYVLVCGDVPAGPKFRMRKYHQTVLNTYDWYGSHQHQYYYTSQSIRELFQAAEIDQGRLLNLDRVCRERLPGQAFQITGAPPARV